MKHFKIQVPEGYEIDQEKSTFGEIVFKPTNPKPEWKDLGHVSGWYISSDSTVVVSSNYVTSGDHNRNTWPSKEEAEAALALSQLCQWRDKYNEGWKPDWTSPKYKLVIWVGSKNNIVIGTQIFEPHILAFKNAEIRDKFLEDFRDLIEIAKPLL